MKGLNIIQNVSTLFKGRCIAVSFIFFLIFSSYLKSSIYLEDSFLTNSSFSSGLPLVRSISSVIYISIKYIQSHSLFEISQRKVPEDDRYHDMRK